MKIQYLKKLGCYFATSDVNSAYLLNFNTNKVIQVPVNFDKMLTNVSDTYVEILHSENILSANEDNFCFDEIYKPTSATFLMTTRCNLNCVYCYAYNDCNKDLSFPIAKAAVDYLIDNAIDKKSNKITIRFHGLGEPTQNFEVLKQITEYARGECRKKGLSVLFHITSNGVMEDSQRQYLQENFDYITLSIDGTKPYQNVQRPLATGDSFVEAIKTLNAVRDKNKLLVRTTVTNFSLENLEEWCGFLNERGVRHINIEPVSICGNCQNNGITDLDNTFSTVFELLCEKFQNMKISYSCFRRSSRPFHCGAFGDNMVVTPFNDISTCYECFDIADKSQSLFIIGRIEDGVVFIDDKKIAILEETCLKLRKECSSCYAQAFCNGSCLSKRYKSFVENGNSYSIVTNKCKITKKIVADRLAERISSQISFTQSERLF